MTYAEAVAYARQCDVCIVPYECAEGMEATKRVLAQMTDAASISIMIGPEGGFAEEEIEAVREDMNVISLGSRILRTDTAAITTMSMVMLAIEMQG